MQRAYLREAQRRHAGHYNALLWQINSMYLAGEVEEALRRFDADWMNIRHSLRWSADELGRDDTAALMCSEIVRGGAHLFELRLTPRDRIAWLQHAVEATEKLSRPLEMAAHLGNLGLACNNSGDSVGAINFSRKADRIYRTAGHLVGRGNSYLNIGIAYGALGKFRNAIRIGTRALEFFRKVGDHRGQGRALSNVGWAYGQLGDVAIGEQYCRRAISVHRTIGNRRSEAHALDNLASVLIHAGRFDDAYACLRNAIDIFESIGDSEGQAYVWDNLGRLYVKEGNNEQALHAFQQACRFWAGTASSLNLGCTQWNIGVTLQLLGFNEEGHRQAAAALVHLSATPSQYLREGLATQLANGHLKLRWI